MQSRVVAAWRLLEIGVEVSGAMKDANDIDIAARPILILVRRKMT
jgi:hypothetical protein